MGLLAPAVVETSVVDVVATAKGASIVANAGVAAADTAADMTFLRTTGDWPSSAMARDVVVVGLVAVGVAVDLCGVCDLKESADDDSK